MRLDNTLLAGITHAVNHRSSANRTSREHERALVTSACVQQLSGVSSWEEFKCFLQGLKQQPATHNCRISLREKGGLAIGAVVIDSLSVDGSRVENSYELALPPIPGDKVSELSGFSLMLGSLLQRIYGVAPSNALMMSRVFRDELVNGPRQRSFAYSFSSAQWHSSVAHRPYGGDAELLQGWASMGAALPFELTRVLGNPHGSKAADIVGLFPMAVSCGFNDHLSDGKYQSIFSDPGNFPYEILWDEKQECFDTLALDYLNAIIPPCWDGEMPIFIGPSLEKPHKPELGGLWTSATAYNLHNAFAEEFVRPLRYLEGETVSYAEAMLWVVKNKKWPPQMPLLSIV